jgi:hypothetical protein
MKVKNQKIKKSKSRKVKNTKHKKSKTRNFKKMQVPANEFSVQICVTISTTDGLPPPHEMTWSNCAGSVWPTQGIIPVAPLFEEAKSRASYFREFLVAMPVSSQRDLTFAFRTGGYTPASPLYRQNVAMTVSRDIHGNHSVA